MQHTRQEMERNIVTAIVDAALAAGYLIDVNNGGDEHEIADSADRDAILAAMFATDDEHLLVKQDGELRGFVHLVYGNGGWDVVNDYTPGMEPILTEADRLADEYAHESLPNQCDECARSFGPHYTGRCDHA